MKNVKKLTVLSIASLAMGLSSCEMQPNAPIGEGTASYGTLMSQNMSDYFYPHAAGYTFVYQNTLETKAGSSTTTYSGSYDTLKTLGHYGTAPNGDSIFAVALKYRVNSTYAGRNPMDMYYKLKNGLDEAMIVDGSTQISGSHLVPDPPPKPISTDTLLATLVGPVKKRTDPAFTGEPTSVWQTDTIWFTARVDSVVIWERFVAGDPLVRARQIFFTDLDKHAGEWQYGLWETSTFWEVKDDNVSVTTPAGTYSCAKINCRTNDATYTVDLPITETKYFAYTRGLCQQIDTWTSTANGTDKITNTWTRKLISVTN